MNELDVPSTPPSAWVGDRNFGLESPTDKGPLQQHPETDNSRWELTTGAVGPTPARLTLTGVWSNAATMDTFISTVRCQREKKSIKPRKLAREKKTTTTQLLNSLGSYIT